MLPFDNRPWAKSLARTVIGLSVVAAIVGAYYLYTLDQLHVPEITGILLLLLTTIPPNIAVLLRKTGARSADPRAAVKAKMSAPMNPGLDLR